MSEARPANPSVDPVEVDKFARLSSEWWDPKGNFAPLHKLNPVRLKLIRDLAAGHFGRSTCATNPFQGLSLLDLGCGGGLLTEPMARLGFTTTGCDAAEENVRVADTHAKTLGLNISYRCTTAESLAAEAEDFDVVLNMEVVEHVPDPREFLRVSAVLVRPGGLLFLATINKTLKSLALAKIAAEYILRWVPAGTHDWNRFLEPRSVHAMLEDAGLKILGTQGMVFDPLSWTWSLSADTGVNYVVVATRPF